LGKAEEWTVKNGEVTEFDLVLYMNAIYMLV